MKRVALIGHGRWGKILLPHLEKRFDVVGVSGRSFHINSDAEAIIVATPIGTHYPIVLKALKKGKHVFCEKPLTTDPKKAQELIDLSVSQGLQLVTDYTYTFSERLKDARQRIGRNPIQSIELVLKRQVPDDKSPYWTLAAHLISILGMFTPLMRLNFTVTNKGTKSIRISFDNGTILINTAAEREMCVRLISMGQQLHFTDLAADDNIGYALDHFKRTMYGVTSNWHNRRCAYLVTKIIHDLKERNG